MSLDRDALIDCLERMTGEDDAAVAAAAREATAMLEKADMEWEEVIRTGLKPPSTGPAIELGEDDDSVRKAIDALLKRDDLNEDTAEDLREYKAALEKGELDPDDRNYILGLYQRIG
ncbi:MAG: hypothetical protein ACMVY4_19040 [Minwuia sp.]|uniref:hypothetical protein n=1 Tax=Minwuia sp. TaxID=2493630 RepID=UPI003A880310